MGRKGTIIITDIMAIISWLLIGFSSKTSAEILFLQLMIARSIQGMLIGMSTTPTVMYSSEVCDPKFRGRLTMLSPFFTAFGMLIIYMLGFIIPVRMPLFILQLMWQLIDNYFRRITDW